MIINQSASTKIITLSLRFTVRQGNILNKNAAELNQPSLIKKMALLKIWMKCNLRETENAAKRLNK